ncbi:MAG: ABC transporter permease, partial [Bacteroidales bacterium]
LTDIFAWICIVISCLGLLGLTSFSTLRRVKEIAVRKVHGAGILTMVMILFRSVFFLLLISILMAIPFGYFIFKLWIRSFVYQAKVEPLAFIFAGIAAILIAFLASCYHTFKAALANPVESLRYE